MKAIRWGIIATGNIAHSFVSDFQFVKNAEVKAVASRSLSKAKDFAKKYLIESAYGDYASLLKDPLIDVVYIATPHNSHFDLIKEAIKHEKPVVCEKPITINAEQCNHVIDIARSSNIYVMEALWTYFLPAIQTVQEWVASDRIGKVQHVEVNFGFEAKYDPRHRLFDPYLAGGALIDIGIYNIAISMLVLPGFPTQIEIKRSTFAPTGVDTEAEILCTYPDGETALLKYSVNESLSNAATIKGSTGSIVIPDFFKAKEAFLYGSNSEVREKFKDTSKSIGYEYEIQSVSSDLQNDKAASSIIPLAKSLEIQQFISLIFNKLTNV